MEKKLEGALKHTTDAIGNLVSRARGDPEPLEVDSVMKKWKSPPSLEFISGAVERFCFVNWQSGNDDSVYYNMNIPSFFKSKVCMPPPKTSVLDRAIDAKLLDLTYYDESTKIETVPLREYLVGPKQVQAMLMMHKGKVVFETYPGMKPNDIHVWMSASKTCAGLLANLLCEEGKLDMDKTVGDYVAELKGTAWGPITMKNVMCMCTGLDVEETFESLSNPESFIATFFTSIFEGKGDWRELLKTAKPIEGEKQGERFRYSTSTTQVIVLAIESITGKPYDVLFNERIWSRIGAKSPFIIGLAPDNTPIGGGLNVTTPEDFLRYASVYTPTGAKIVTKEGAPIVSDKVLKSIFDMGSPDAYMKGAEAAYGFRWFGEQPFKNSAQWDHLFPDGAMFKHGNMGQGIYVDPKRDFCGVYFGLASNDESKTGVDHSPGYLRAAAKKLHGS